MYFLYFLKNLQCKLYDKLIFKNHENYPKGTANIASQTLKIALLNYIIILLLPFAV